jgi:hypothetical protein
MSTYHFLTILVLLELLNDINLGINYLTVMVCFAYVEKISNN